MLALVVSLALAAGTGPIGTPCEPDAEAEASRPMDVCDPLLEGGNAYSATMTASLTPPPATQQVVIYRLEGNWFLYAEGYRWNGSLVETRRNDVRISDADAAAIEGSRHAARQHSCAGQTELTRTAALFKEMALKYDPAFEGYLSGL